VDGLLKLAIDGHGRPPRWEQISRFRAAASVTGAIWALKGKPGLLYGVVLQARPATSGCPSPPFPSRPAQHLATRPADHRDRRRRAGRRAP